MTAVDPARILESVAAASDGNSNDAHGPRPKAAQAEQLARCLDTYRRWMYLDDDGQALFGLGIVAGNLLPTDPVWGLVVAAPGAGKTEGISPFAALPYVHPAATVTEASLLSGTSAKETEKGATGGLLRQVGAFGVLLMKDFTSVLTMHRDARAAAMSALREVFDGSWDRPVGTGGGRVLSWKGKCGVLGAVTPTIDGHHAVLGALGERFVLYRLDAVEPRAQSRRRLVNRGSERQMRAELGQAVVDVLAGVALQAPLRALTEGETDRLIEMSVMVVHARSAVERDGYSREVVVMPTPEAPGRLVGAMSTLLAGLEAVGADPDQSWGVLSKAAWDCVPDMRRRLLIAVRDQPNATTSQLVTATNIPRSTAHRELEDLRLLELVGSAKDGAHDTSAWRWNVVPEVSATWLKAFPEKAYKTI